ncbi:MAG TPA: LacI family DNA-binding transcriptional regulator [Fimbriimonas sp.]
MYRTRVQSRNTGRPTRDDVARYANISGATVSRVLSGRTDLSISPETRAKVLEAAKKLGYLPNSAARALTNGRTGLVGFWMSLEYSRYRGAVLDQMRNLLRGTDMALAVSDVDEEYNWAHSFDRALRVPVDGILAFDNSASVEAFTRESDRLAPRIPFVSMGAYWSGSKSYVGVDLRAGADTAMSHLTSIGCRRIAYFAPWTSELIDSGPRYDAYVAAMDEAGLPKQTLACERVAYQPIKEALVECAAGNKMPEALLCMNDEIAIASANILQGFGLRVGHDIAIVGFDGIEETAHCPVPMTTVRQPIEEMCALAWQYLKTQMEDPASPPKQRILVPELVVRESTRP